MRNISSVNGGRVVLKLAHFTRRPIATEDVSFVLPLIVSVTFGLLRHYYGPINQVTWSNVMQMQVGDVSEGVLNVSLTGRLDTPGIDEIETQLTAHLVPRAARAILDLSQVTFVASGGIRLFITIARALDRKGGKLVLYGAQPPVAQVLETTSLNELVPVRPDSHSATAAARA